MLRLACQTYTWQMLGDRWQRPTVDILDQIAAAGYAGIEITEKMIGEFAGRPQRFSEALTARGLSFACYAVTLGSAFANSDLTADLLRRVDHALAWIRDFQGIRLQLGSPQRQKNAGSRADQLARACDLCNRIGRKSGAAGIPLHVHPNSAETSLVRSFSEYRYLLTHLDPDHVALCIDTGHVRRCGIEPLKVLDLCGSSLVHLHLKDVTEDGQWTLLGQGVCPLRQIATYLRHRDYRGWVVCEEEADVAAHNPGQAVAEDLIVARATGFA